MICVANMSVCCPLFIFCYVHRRKIQVTNRVHASEQHLEGGCGAVEIRAFLLIGLQVQI